MPKRHRKMKIDYIFRVIEAGGARTQDLNARIGTFQYIIHICCSASINSPLRIRLQKGARIIKLQLGTDSSKIYSNMFKDVRRSKISNTVTP